MRHGSWMIADRRTAVLHLARSGDRDGYRRYHEDLEEACAILADLGHDPDELVCTEYDEDGDVLRPC